MFSYTYLFIVLLETLQDIKKNAVTEQCVEASWEYITSWEKNMNRSSASAL